MRKDKILVWDVPTRLIHWTLALAFLGAFLTADSERYRDLHVMLGYTMLGAIAARVIWGLVGTRYARFSSFLYGPKALVSYLGSLVLRKPQHFVGHNPAGSIAIYLLLALGVSAGVSGYATYNELAGEWIEEAHEALANLMLGVVLVHIAGVLVSSWLHGENLVSAMVTGRKRGERNQGIRHTHAWLAGVLVAALVAGWYAGAADTSAPNPGSAGRVGQQQVARASDHEKD